MAHPRRKAHIRRSEVRERGVVAVEGPAIRCPAQERHHIDLDRCLWQLAEAGQALPVPRCARRGRRNRQTRRQARQTDGGHTAVELLATERLQSMATRTSEVAAPAAPRAAGASSAAAAGSASSSSIGGGSTGHA